MADYMTVMVSSSSNFLVVLVFLQILSHRDSQSAKGEGTVPRTMLSFEPMVLVLLTLRHVYNGGAKPKILDI